MAKGNSKLQGEGVFFLLAANPVAVDVVPVIFSFLIEVKLAITFSKFQHMAF